MIAPVVILYFLSKIFPLWLDDETGEPGETAERTTGEYLTSENLS
jgi:hypothetical protein